MRDGLMEGMTGEDYPRNGSLGELEFEAVG